MSTQSQLSKMQHLLLKQSSSGVHQLAVLNQHPAGTDSTPHAVCLPKAHSRHWRAGKKNGAGVFRKG
ncbi:hypothetical protein ACQ69G_003445 [Yersinia enterocolitica]